MTMLNKIFIQNEFTADFVVFSFYKTIIIYQVIKLCAAIVVMALVYGWISW